MSSVKFLCLLGAFMLCYAVKAQNEKWAVVEKECNLISKQIEKGEYLVNELKINSNRLALPNNDYFQHWEKFFYVFDQRIAENSPPILKAVIIKTERDGQSIYKEYMYDNAGKCIYFSEIKQNDKNALNDRVRVYLFDDKPIRWFKDDADITYDTEKPEKLTAIVLELSKQLKEKFLKQLD